MMNLLLVAPLLLALEVQAGLQKNGYRPCSDFPQYQFGVALVPATIDMGTYSVSPNYSIECRTGNASLQTQVVATALYVANPQFSAFSPVDVKPVLNAAGCFLTLNERASKMPAVKDIVPDVTPAISLPNPNGTMCEYHFDSLKSNNFWTPRGCPWEQVGCRFVFFGLGDKRYNVYECTVDKPLQITPPQPVYSMRVEQSSFTAGTYILQCLVDGSSLYLRERDWRIKWYWFPYNTTPSEDNKREMTELSRHEGNSVLKSSETWDMGLCRSRWVSKLKVTVRPEDQGSQFQCWLVSWDGQRHNKSIVLSLS